MQLTTRVRQSTDQVYLQIGSRLGNDHAASDARRWAAVARSRRQLAELEHVTRHDPLQRDRAHHVTRLLSQEVDAANTLLRACEKFDRRRESVAGRV